MLATGAVLPDNNFSYEKWELEPSFGQYQTPRVFDGGFSYQQRFASYSPYPSSGVWTVSPSLGTNGVNSKLIKKMKGQQWNLPVFLLELGKTSSMVVRRATDLALLANELRRGNIVGFVKRLHKTVIPPSKAKQRKFLSEFGKRPREAAANAWLEYSYGWKPFMKDVHDAVMTLMDLLDRPDSMVHRVTASEKQTVKRFLSDVQVFGDTDESLSIHGDVISYGTESLRATWRFKPNALDMPGKLGLTNPLEVAWELLPFSFVADWFLPIGDYLASLDVPIRVAHVGGTYGRRIETMNETVPKRVRTPALATSSGFAGRGHWVWVQRTKMTGAPSISLSQASVKYDLNSSQVTSAISLLNQQLSKLRVGR